MDIRVKIEWPEMVEAVRESIALRKAPSPEPTTHTPPEPGVVEEPKEPLVTLEQVRTKLATLSQAGKQPQVKALIASFDAEKLSDIPQERYAELLEKAEAL